MNPYRYSTSAETHGTLPTDYANTHPDWIVDCGGIKILNPCLPAVKERIAAVVADVTRNYDIDGVIFDDYFYQSGYQNSYDDAYYSASGTTLNRADWRRAQVNEMVRMVHDSIKAIKPYVRFVLPLLIVVIYIKGYYDMFSKYGTTSLIFWMCVAAVFLALIYSFATGRSKE